MIDATQLFAAQCAGIVGSHNTTPGVTTPGVANLAAARRFFLTPANIALH